MTRSRGFRAALMILGVLAVWTAPLVEAEDGAPSSRRVANSARPVAGELERTRNRFREGDELVDQLGTFAVTGDRVTFFLADSDVALQVLENLALERVTRVLEETRRSDVWQIRGTITECRGSNYLLLTRAVVTSRVAP